MNIEAVRAALTIICLLACTILDAQSIYQLGALPAINVNSQLRDDLSINTKVESRQRFQSGTLNGETDGGYAYVLTDVSAIAAKGIGLNSRLAGGYLLRFNVEELVHRTIQQYIIVQRLSGFRLAHRFVADQTFSASEAPEFRLRYRITSEIPLNGESVDPTEFYVKLNNEYVASHQATSSDLEVRVVPLLGYDISESNKVEFGLDYRISSFVNDATRQSFWISLNWYVDL